MTFFFLSADKDSNLLVNYILSFATILNIRHTHLTFRLLLLKDEYEPHFLLLGTNQGKMGIE